MIGLARYAKWIRAAGYPLFTMAMFIVMLRWTFPDERVKQTLEDHLSTPGKMKITIGDVDLAWGVGLHLHEVKVRVESEGTGSPSEKTESSAKKEDADEPKAEPKAARLLIDEIEFHTTVGTLWGINRLAKEKKRLRNDDIVDALFKGGDIEINVKGLGGTIDAGLIGDEVDGTSLKLEARDVDIRQIPAPLLKIGLPVSGALSVKFDLHRSPQGWSKSMGSIELNCDRCAIGDGKAKLKIPGNAFLAQGISMPPLRLGTLTGMLKLTDGQLNIETFTAQSADAELNFEGMVRLQDRLEYSSLFAYLRIKLTDDLKRRQPNFETFESFLTAGKRADGFFGLRFTGTFKTPSAMPSTSPPIAPGGGGVPSRNPYGPPPGARPGSPS